MYSNDEPEIRADKKSVAGRYVIIELGELRELEFVKLDAEGNDVAERFTGLKVLQGSPAAK